MRLTQLKMDWRVVTVIITSTLILTIESYNNLFKNTHLDSFFFYLVLPLIIIRVVLREVTSRIWLLSGGLEGGTSSDCGWYPGDIAGGAVCCPF